MTTITATVTHSDTGASKVVAKGAGKQRTITYDHAMSHDRNIGTAAGTLAQVLGLSYSDSIVHTQDGPKHKFLIP